MKSDKYRELSLLLNNIKNGSRDAFAGIYEMYEKKVYFFTSKMIKDPSDAKRMTIQFFDYLYLQTASFGNAADFEKWLYKTLYSRCRRFLIENRPESFGNYIDSDSPEGEKIDVEIAKDADAMMKAGGTFDVSVDMMNTMDRILSELPLKLRSSTLLYFFCGLDMEEVATAEQISLAAVKNRLLKAHIRLQTEEHKYSEMGVDINGVVTFLPEVLSQMAEYIETPVDIASGVTASTGVNCMRKGSASDEDETMILPTMTRQDVRRGSNYSPTDYATPTEPKKGFSQGISPTVKVLMAIVAILIIIGGTVAVVLAIQGRHPDDENNGTVSSVDTTTQPRTIEVTTRETTVPETTTESESTTEPETTTEPTTLPQTTETTAAQTTLPPVTETTTLPVAEPEPDGNDTPVDNADADNNQQALNF